MRCKADPAASLLTHALTRSEIRRSRDQEANVTLEAWNLTPAAEREVMEIRCRVVLLAPCGSVALVLCGGIDQLVDVDSADVLSSSRFDLNAAIGTKWMGSLRD